MHIRKPPKNCVCERFNYKSALMYFRTSIPTLFHGHTSHLYILYHFAHTHTHFPTPERVSRQNRYERSPQCAYTFYTHPVYVCAVRANWRTFRNYRPRVNIQRKHSAGLQMLSVFEKRRSNMARFLVLCRLNSPFDVLECCELRVFGDRCRVCWSRLNEFFFLGVSVFMLISMMISLVWIFDVQMLVFYIFIVIVFELMNSRKLGEDYLRS